MDIEEFKSSIDNETPPNNLPPLLTALWLERRGQWDKAHSIAQEIPTQLGSWVHAYLHRVEGDRGNARYWYRRSGHQESSLSQEKEWEEIAEYLLSEAQD